MSKRKYVVLSKFNYNKNFARSINKKNAGVNLTTDNNNSGFFKTPLVNYFIIEESKFDMKEKRKEKIEVNKRLLTLIKKSQKKIIMH